MGGYALPILLVFGMLLVSVVAMYAILLQENKKKTKKAQMDNVVKQAKRYKFLYDNFLTRKSFRKVCDQLASLSIYTLEEIRELSLKYYTSTLGMCIVLIFVGIVALQEITGVLLCICFAMIMFNVLIMKQIDKTHMAVIIEFSDTLSSIRETYTLTGNIPDAVNDCRKGKLLPKTLDKIYLILTATDAEDRLEEFYRTVPFPMLQTLAGVCYLLYDAGDEENEKGQSAFKNAITLLKNEADLEVRKLTKQKIMFSMLEWLPLAPIPFIGIMEWFFTTFMPGTAVIYNGMLGYMSRTLIILTAIYAYWYITNVTSPNAVRRDDRSDLVNAFLYWKPFNKIMLPDILPKKLRPRLKIEKELKGALSNKDIKYIYASKVMASTVAFIATLAMLTIFTYLGKQFTYNNVRPTTFLGGSDMTVEEERIWHQIDDEVLARKNPPSNSTLINNNYIKSFFPDKSTQEIKEAADRIIAKYKQYHSLRFHWWYVVIAYAVAAFAWFSPGITLDMRKKLVQAEEEEDVLQLQTMLAILRYTNLETMEALYWLARQSRIHQTALYYAYHEYPSDPELSLERLRDKSNLPSFQQICERLISTVSQVSIKEAFADLEAERDHMLRIREMVQTNAIEAKRRKCSPISRAPIMVFAFGHFMMPIGVLAYNEITNMMTQLGAV